MPESSPETVVDATTTTDTTAAVNADQVSDGNSSKSSTEDQGGNMLDAVKAAIAPKEASPASQTPDQTAEAAADDSKKEVEEESDELSAEELKAVSQKTQGRFKRLTSKLKAKDDEITSLKPKADQFDQISKFVTDAGMTGQEVSFMLSLGAHIASGNAPKALEQLRPVMAELERLAGEVLPADLQEQVRLGYLTEAHAKDLNRSRANERIAKERADREANARRDSEQKSQGKALIDTTLSAIEKWEANKAEKDPDWHLKRKDVSEQVELAISRGARERGNPNWFPTAEEALKLADTALKEINGRFKRSSSPTEIRPVNGGASIRSAAKPSSMLDVVKNAVAG